MRKATVLAGAIPLTVMASVYIEAILVRLSLGKWPAYGMPDPANLPQPLLGIDVGVTLAFLLLYPLTLLAVVGACISLLRRFRWSRPASLAWLVGAGVVLGMVLVDPGGIFSWLMD